MEYNYQPSKPSSNLALAILTTILCCLPLGIVAIVKASQVDGHWSAGRYQEAYDAAKSARNWAIGGIVSGIVGFIIYLIIYVAYGVVLGASLGLFDEFADDADYLDDSSYIYDYDSDNDDYDYYY